MNFFIFQQEIKTTIQLFAISIHLLGQKVKNLLIIIIGDIFLFISLFTTFYTGFLYTMHPLKANES